MPGDEPLVLVVDATDDGCDLLRAILEHAGYRVVCCLSPEAAIRVAATMHPSVILLDLSLPTVATSALLGTLRASTLRPLALVALSTSDDLLASAEASLDFTATIRKPFDIARLLETIACCLTPAGDAQSVFLAVSGGERRMGRRAPVPVTPEHVPTIPVSRNRR